MRLFAVALLLVTAVTPALARAAPSASGDDVRILDARARWETLNLIRQDKFDLILPGAMRDNGVDMWIHVIRWGDPDPLELDLGAEFGTFVFADRGGERIERASSWAGPFHLQASNSSMSTTIIGSTSDRASSHRRGARPTRRSPSTARSGSAVADGMSHTDYEQHPRGRWGPTYTGRLVSADQLITDFRVRRVDREIAAFSTAGEMTRRTASRSALSNEVITPGLTTLPRRRLVGAGEAARDGRALRPSVSVTPGYVPNRGRRATRAVDYGRGRCPSNVAIFSPTIWAFAT